LFVTLCIELLERDSFIMTHILAPLAAYCAAFGRFVRAERMLRVLGDSGADGLLTKTAKGQIIQNPLVRIARQAAAAAVAFGNEFGLSPSSRVKVAASPPHGGHDPAGKYFDD